MKVCAICVFAAPLHAHLILPFTQFAALILGALVAVAAASVVEVRAPVAAIDLEARVRSICPP